MQNCFPPEVIDCFVFATYIFLYYIYRVISILNVY